tara:strand:- start:487 stop:1050 length:564 start_codon:yes stop_codon:yes gene_type:complete
MNIFDDFNLIKFKNQKPPTDNSLTTLKEIKEIDNLKIDVSFVKYYDEVYDVFKKIIEKNGYEFPSDLVKYLINNSRETILNLKNYHKRSRPNEIAKNYNINLDVVDLKSAKTKAYPSGHSAQAELIGLVLSDIYPNLRSQIMKEANNISLSRNIGRLHYASDSQNGLDLGKAMYQHYKTKANALYTK